MDENIMNDIKKKKKRNNLVKEAIERNIKIIPLHESLNTNSLIREYIQNGGYIERIIP